MEINWYLQSIMNAVANTKTNLPNFKNDGRMHVHLIINKFGMLILVDAIVMKILQV